MERPSYDGDGLVNLISWLGEALGGGSGSYPGQDPGDSLEVAQARTVILWVIDGLGDYELARHPGSALARDRVRGLTSVFPATTSAALTSIVTGHPPRGHGITGWFMYVHELGAVTAWLPFGPRVGRGQWTELEPQSAGLLAREPFWDHLDAEVHVVQPSWLVNTPYSRATTGQRACRHGYRGLEGLLETLTGIACAPGQRRRFVYAYWPEFDALCHQHGTESAPVQEHFLALDRAWQRLLDGVRNTGTLVLGTADHGLIDTAPERVLYLEDHPELAETLALPLCGEPRAAYCYLRSGAEADFQAYVRERLGPVCRAVRSEELLAAGWFGPAPEHPQLRRRIGDWTLLPADGWVIKDRLVGEGDFAQLGVHGGASAAELWVPLIAARPC
ncbi:MAG: alkaline phosphatase family protein [Halorhodospira sp.]